MCVAKPPVVDLRSVFTLNAVVAVHVLLILTFEPRELLTLLLALGGRVGFDLRQDRLEVLLLIKVPHSKRRRVSKISVDRWPLQSFGTP